MKTAIFNRAKHRCKGTMLKQIAIIALFATVMTACKTTQPTTIVRDSVRVEYHLDSIYLYERDSIYVDRYTANDTVYLTTEKWLTRYKDKIVLQHDTISVTHEDTIVQEVKYIPSFYKGCTIALWIIIVAVILYIAFRVVKAIYLHK